ncbi:MAG: hypothetical protein WCD53_15555 [Microcoleus sp.]
MVEQKYDRYSTRLDMTRNFLHLLRLAPQSRVEPSSIASAAQIPVAILLLRLPLNYQ